MFDVGVTGGTGFIGRELVLQNLAAGNRVRLLFRHPTSEIALPDSVHLFHSDLTGDWSHLLPFVDGLDVLYHCASEIHDDGKMHQVNVVGTKNLCIAAGHKIGHWVQLSSVGVYGSHSEGIISEETSLNPIGVYEETKVESDRIVIEASRRGNFSYSILRPSNIFGPTMANQSLFQLISVINNSLFFFIGKPGASANYIHVANVVEALMQCGTLSAAHGRIYNLSDYCTVEGFVSIISKALGKPMTSLRMPKNVTKFVAMLCGRLPFFPLTVSKVEALTNRSVYSWKRIQRELGYSHKVSIKDGLHQMVEAWKQKAI